LTEPRLASGFWVAAKLRQLQNAGGYASILVKGDEQAGAITLVLRNRDGTVKLATPAIDTIDGSSERRFVWRDGFIDDAALNAVIERELRFDRDQWFVEIECSEDIFVEIFDIHAV
jgi:hypothetical protein